VNAQIVEPPHPVVACTEQASAAITEALGYQPVFMDADAKRAALAAISKQERQLAALKLRVMAASADVADVHGARDVAAWLASRTQADPVPLRAQHKLAAAIDQKWTQVAHAMAQGGVSIEQAQVIVAGLDALPTRVGGEVIAAAEAHLVELAADHNPKELRILAAGSWTWSPPRSPKGKRQRGSRRKSDKLATTAASVSNRSVTAPPGSPG
jgi:hypothetical protein